MKASFLVLSLFAVQQAPAKLRSWESEKPIQSAVVEVRDFKNLGLYLYSPQNTPYLRFSRLDAALRKGCRILQFAMNAGMYHADFSPVGLYIENGQQLRGLNKAKHGFGNFFIQPNGVLAWVTFYQFASYFKDSLKTDNALYLDGSISSLYSSGLNLHDASRDLGPMLAYSEPSACK